MSTRFEYILIGVGINDATTKGEVCNPPPEWPDTCPKGVPSFRGDQGSAADKYAEDGYITIQGPGKPEVLGGAQFDSEAAALQWLSGTDGDRFKAVFMNVFLSRVVARSQARP